MKKFTLIELIMVVVVLGILASIVSLNINDAKESSIKVALMSNISSIQTASDSYRLDHEQYPSLDQPTKGVPSKVDFSILTPSNLISNPKLGYYWIDSMGTIWGSLVDSPTGLQYNNDLLT